MKKKIAALLLSTAMLAGCAGTISEPAAEAAPQPEAGQTAGPAEAVKELTRLTDTASSSTGVYLAEADPHGFTHTLYYVDAQTATMQPLCPLENCSHDNSECPAWIPDGQNVFLIADGETLYAAATEYSNRLRTEIQQSDTFALTIWAYTLDGKTRTQIFSQNIELPLESRGGETYPMPVSAMYYDGTYFYAWVEDAFEKTKTAGRTAKFVKIDPQTGTYEAMPSPVEAVQKADPDFENGYSEGVIKGDLVLNGYHRETDNTMMYAVRMDGSSVYKIPEEAAYTQKAYAPQKGIFYLIPPKDGAVQILCYTPGAQRAEVWAEVSGLTGADTANIYEHCSLTADCMGNPILTNHAAEPQQSYLCLPGGRVVPCTLQTTYSEKDQDLSYLVAAAPAGEQILAFLRTETYSAFSMDWNGDISLGSIYTKQYALISREDYENQTPNYRLVNRA